MTDFTRRQAFAVAVGAAAATLPLDRQARAAVPPAGKQSAGWYRYKIGSIEVTVATDGVARFKMAEDHVINIKKDAVNAALAEVFMEKDMMTTPYNPVAINTGGKLAVIDTGTGEANYNNSKGVGGQFITNLAAAGIERAAVDTVIISHYHGDHINGLLMADGSLTYPNAEILVPAVEHKYWMDDGEMSRATNGRVQTNFKNVRRACHSCSCAIPTGTRSMTRMAPWRKLPAAKSTTCWWRTRCGCRDSIIRSRRWLMWRNTAPAIAKSRWCGIRRSDFRLEN
jgi:hypothetical protein